MLKIMIFTLIACILSVIIRRNCIELYLPFQIGVAITVFIYTFNYATDEITSFFSFVDGLGADSGIIKSLIKASLITIASKLGCDICKESGNILVGDVIGLGGKLMIFVISVPYIITIINISAEFLK